MGVLEYLAYIVNLDQLLPVGLGAASFRMVLEEMLDGSLEGLGLLDYSSVFFI